MMKQFSGVMGVLFLLSGCAAPEMGQRTKMGTGVGVAAGAALGAIIGHQSGKTGQGAVIGGVVGGLAGGLVGKRLDKQAQELSEVAETKRTEEGILTTLKNNILFETNSAVLKPEAIDQIGQVAKIIARHPEDHVTVVGHTDSKGTPDYNQLLSEKRAQAVRLQIVSHGVPPGNAEAVGQGESQPIASNDSEEGRAKNRRVEIIISVPPEHS